MPRVADVAGLLDVLGRHGFAVDAKRCVRVRNRNVHCDACMNACVSGCISLADGQLSVNTERCIGCGSCATACPTGALRKTEPTDADIMAEVSDVCEHNAGVVVFACASIIERVGSALDPDSVVKVACLGRVDEAMLAGTAAAGATRIVLVTDDCEACSYAKARSLISRVTDGAVSLFSAWNITCPVKVTTKFPKLCAAEEGAAYDVRRREFLAGIGTLAKTGGRETVGYLLDKSLDEAAPEPAFEHVDADGTLPHCQSARHAMVANTLEALGTPGPDAMVHSRLWAALRIDAQACTGCAMCAVFCPTGALAKRKEVDEEASAKPLRLYRAPGNPKAGTEDKPRQVMKHHPGTSASSSFATGEAVYLVHTPGLCVNCGACRDLCPAHAITLAEDMRADELVGGAANPILLKDIFREKGGPDAIKNSMSKLVNSPYLWG